MNFDNAIVYDIECLPNIFTFAMEMLNSDVKAVWEISEWRDDRQSLLEFFQWLSRVQAPMIGFNNVHYDYPVIHELWKNPGITYANLRVKSDAIISSNDRFGQTVWASDRFAPQVDLYKLNHFDNVAKSTSLKALQINMRSPNVVESEIPFDRPCSLKDRDDVLIPYNQHDVSETKRFAFYNIDAINFRIGLIDQFGVDVLNWNDTKIGEQTVIQKLGEDVCYTRNSYGSRVPRQSPRGSVAIADVILPYIRFDDPGFNNVLNYFRGKVLDEQQYDEFSPEGSKLKTKGVMTDLSAIVGGVKFVFGVGGLHGAVENKRIHSSSDYMILDVDVGAMYPSVIIANGFCPGHMTGTRFGEVYSGLPIERKHWQKEKGKKCTEANVLKLASNGVYGKSNSSFSPFYDPQLMISTTVNGQLNLAMLIEKMTTIPTVQILQGNTDGITLYLHRGYYDQVLKVCKDWEELTKLTLEYSEYSRMFIKNVNAYIAIGLNGDVKSKKEYWTPDPLHYHKSISEAQPSAWHKNFSNLVSRRAAVAHMVHNVDIEQFIRMTTNPYDFCIAVKVKRSDQLLHGDIPQQRNSRFYVSRNGKRLVKGMPPKGVLGTYKKNNKVTDARYQEVMSANGGQWDEEVCTKNRSKHEYRKTSIIEGLTVSMCNNIADFDWSNVNYDYYINEARKLVI
jgi:hypothetical protein